MIGEARTAQELVALLPRKKFGTVVQAARESGAESELDFGVMVSPAKPAVGVDFTPEDLRYCGDIGVSIVVSAYAAADE
jgi:hypothetical protein